MALLITKDRGEELFNKRKRDALEWLNERVQAAINKEIANFFNEARTDYDSEAAIEKARSLGLNELADDMQSDLNSAIDFDF